MIPTSLCNLQVAQLSKPINLSCIHYRSFETKTYLPSACATINRELIRVNIPSKLTKTILLVGFVLLWRHCLAQRTCGTALERGATFSRRIDLVSNKIFASVSSEGKGILEENRKIHQSRHFNVMQSNTKGKAWWRSFAGTFNSSLRDSHRLWTGTPPLPLKPDYWTQVMIKSLLIIRRGSVIRKTFFDGGVDEVVTTRRLVHLKHKRSLVIVWSIKSWVNRFDEDTKQSFPILYFVDAGEDSANMETKFRWSWNTMKKNSQGVKNYIAGTYNQHYVTDKIQTLIDWCCGDAWSIL